ncbi:hypothetical protein X766_16105 [Mesorhizobium sp. LSJC255A00]|uniref:hypothetical protein n=1 Tax=Mesorhizobium sp. LSJC255A00 TaxID=1287313 RepID=UPI0003CEBFCE|nr:hypothetical protein [Mesorhizobium sp. LSJC255A00]ESX17908.1 hypothetical protein X766_16105 [Mesorhizobium sp. LSJC255A00]
MGDFSVDLDIDLWGRGRGVNGQLGNQWLRDHYPHVDLYGTKFGKNEPRTLEILQEFFERDHNEQYPFLLRFGVVFFQEKEQADLFRGLLYIY